MEYTHLFGPYITHLKTICETDQEWLNILSETPYINIPIGRWVEWVSNLYERVIASGKIGGLPMITQELEYFSSPFLDTLNQLEGQNVRDALLEVCKLGNLDVLTFLVGELKLLWADSKIQQIINLPSKRSWFKLGFELACTHGHLEIAKWLNDVFPDVDPRGSAGYTYPDNRLVTIYFETPFIDACENGHLEIVKWLKSRFPDIDHRRFDDVAFRKACVNGHIHVAKWLKSNFPDINHKSDRQSAIINLRCKVNENRDDRDKWVELLSWLENL